MMDMLTMAELRAELKAVQADARIKGDERDALERERDWLRGVARGLLRVARAAHELNGDIVLYELIPDNPVYAEAWADYSELRAALAALEPGVRRLVDIA